MNCPTREDFFRIGADEALARSNERTEGRRLSPEEIYTEGSDANILIAAMSAMADEVMRVSLGRFAELLISTASGEALDRIIADRFNGEVPRLEASPSVGDAILFRDLALSSGDLVIPTGTKIRSRTGIVVQTVFPVTFSAGAAGPITGRVQAVETGPQGNMLPDELVAFVNPILGVSVTNNERLAGGDDSEPDDRYRRRASRFFVNVRRGTLSAIEFGALTVQGVRLATAFEDVDALGVPTGHISLFIADATGAGNAALAQKVREAITDWQAAGVPVIVFVSTPRFVPIVVAPQFESGVDSTLAFEEFRRRLVSRVNELRPAETLDRSLIYDVGRSVTGMIVRDSFVVEPVGDIVPAAGETLRASLASITVAP